MMLFISVLMLLTLRAVGEVVKDFKDHDCKEFFLDEEPPEFQTNGIASQVPEEGRYVRICQRYKNKYHYATLYDTTEKIPVYSAYRYERTIECKVKRPNIPWKIEPQLEDNNNGKDMASEKNVWKNDRQAYDSNYVGTDYNKGHLFPVCQSSSDDSAISTFTLTNAAPQGCSFNKKWFHKVENDVRKSLQKCVNERRIPYVVTGVVPSDGTKMANRVNVPVYFWTAYRCCGSNQCQFGGYIMNEKADVTRDFTDMTSFDERLSEYYKRPFTVFKSAGLTGKKRKFDERV
ncbi:endonuclease domain-containing 1 protein-like [Pygocentrus nattereri]|uniref:Endonuclease domain-containing 1 protein-like n=1 Tax=Pygocentrus nattereri TaxID=42514 RepID=A0A3B4CWH5_PYGNA|nr:endonuclease domain-containing 1 protein-like [Pygocentrus nattereri]